MEIRTNADLLEALRALRLGCATIKQQKIAARHYGYLLGAQGDEPLEHYKNKKSLHKKFLQWRRMEFVFELIHDPTLGGLVDDVEPMSLNQASQIVAEKEGVSHRTVERAYEKLKADIGEENLGEYIDRKVSELWQQSIAGK